MSNLVNRLVVRELNDAFLDVDGMLLVAFGGLTVAESEELRNQMAERGARFRMIRNSLARRVFAERGLEFAGDALLGNTAVAYGSVEAVVAAAKILTSPQVRKAKKITLKAALLEGRVLDAPDAVALAAIPDRDTLNAMLLGCLSGPARGLVGVLNGLPSGLVRVLQARSEQLTEQEGAPAAD